MCFIQRATKPYNHSTHNKIFRSISVLVRSCGILNDWGLAYGFCFLITSDLQFSEHWPFWSLPETAVLLLKILADSACFNTDWSAAESRVWNFIRRHSAKHVLWISQTIDTAKPCGSKKCWGKCTIEWWKLLAWECEVRVGLLLGLYRQAVMFCFQLDSCKKWGIYLAFQY